MHNCLLIALSRSSKIDNQAHLALEEALRCICMSETPATWEQDLEDAEELSASMAVRGSDVAGLMQRARLLLRKYGGEFMVGEVAGPLPPLEWAPSFGQPTRGRSRLSLQARLGDLIALLTAPSQDQLRLHDPATVAARRAEYASDATKQMAEELRQWQRAVSGPPRMPANAPEARQEERSLQAAHARFLEQVRRNVRTLYGPPQEGEQLPGAAPRNAAGEDWRSDAERDMLFAVPGYEEEGAGPARSCYVPMARVLQPMLAAEPLLAEVRYLAVQRATACRAMVVQA